MVKDSLKVGYTEHLLSSRSYKNKWVILMGENLKEQGQVYKKIYWKLVFVTFEHGTCLFYVSQLRDAFVS
jgi:hypothetical protein